MYLAKLVLALSAVYITSLIALESRDESRLKNTELTSVFSTAVGYILGTLVKLLALFKEGIFSVKSASSIHSNKSRYFYAFFYY